MTTRTKQQLHNFGTLSQRWSWGLFQTIGERVNEILGSGAVVLTIFGLWFLFRRGVGHTSVGATIVAFLMPFFLFPTLYEVHAYYSVACGVFLIFAVAKLLTEES